jgi:serine protease AprX
MRSKHSFLIFTLFVSSLVFPGIAFSQRSHEWLFLKDRAAFSDNMPAQSLGISDRAMHRRAKVLPHDRLIDALDAPLPEEYLAAIRATGAIVRSTSRWLNAVSIETTPEQRDACVRLPFVRTAEPVAVFVRSLPEKTTAPPLYKREGSTALDYGQSFTQLNNIKVVDVHNLGINGSGVIVGMLDEGFTNHKVHTALKGIRVLAEYDFVQRDSNTSRQPGEFIPDIEHGAATLSALAGFESGKLIGPAYGASLLLAKTEVDSVEVRIEEDYYVAGLEWLERLGADIASSSLGYIDWYTYRDLDGKTATTSKAARVAARKGLLLVTAAGNQGNYRTFNPDSTGTLIAPADTDSIVTVGAASSTGQLVGFSSTGPSFDGRIKPEVVAQGLFVYCADGNTTSGYFPQSGTSLSTPLTAGVAALVLSAHPDLTPMQVREALIQTAVRINDGTSKTSVYPNNFYGYGMVNALSAVLYHGLVFSNRPQITVNGSTMTVAISIASKNPLVADSLFLYYRPNINSLFQRVRLTATGQVNMYSVSIPWPGGTVFPQAYFYARDNSGNVRMNPYDAPSSLFTLQDTVQVGTPFNPIPDNFILHYNFPNPFNPGTTIRFDAPTVSNVELVVYNSLGQRVRTLFRGNSRQGVNLFAWNDSRSDDGVVVASGVYFAVLRTPTVTLTNPMILIR